MIFVIFLSKLDKLVLKLLMLLKFVDFSHRHLNLSWNHPSKKAQNPSNSTAAAAAVSSGINYVNGSSSFHNFKNTGAHKHARGLKYNSLEVEWKQKEESDQKTTPK